MKTVSGEVISSKSISLKKAAKVLSKFASSDNGASPAFAAYLRRASDSFNELLQLHKETKLSGSGHKVIRCSNDGSVGTYELAINSGDKGLVEEIDSKKRKESRRVNKGEGESGRSNVRTEVRKVEGIVDENGLKNEIASFDGSMDTHTKKREKLGTEKVEVIVNIEKKKQSSSNSENVGSSQAVDTRKKHGEKEKKNRDQPYGDHAPITIKNEIESIDQSKVLKKKKNKQHNDDDAELTETAKFYGDKKNGQPSGGYATYVADVKNEIDSLDGNKEKKKKKKRNDHEKIKSEVIDKEKEMHSEPSTQDVLYSETTRVVENAIDDHKKRKKKKNKNEMKEERFGNDINGDERRNESNKVRGNAEIVDKKKQIHDGKERKNEGKLEIEGADNKESRKRKHESIVAGGVDGSQEQHNLKKKKR